MGCSGSKKQKPEPGQPENEGARKQDAEAKQQRAKNEEKRPAKALNQQSGKSPEHKDEPVRHAGAVRLEPVRQPSADSDTVEEVTTPHLFAAELAAQQVFNQGDRISGDVDCFLCGGTGQRQVERTEPMPAIPTKISPLRRSATIIPADGGELASHTQGASGGGASGLQRAISLTTYLAAGKRNDGNVTAEKEDAIASSTEVQLPFERAQSIPLQAVEDLQTEQKAAGGDPGTNDTSSKSVTFKFRRTGKNSFERVIIDSAVCWVCEGSGKQSAYVDQLRWCPQASPRAEETKDAPDCLSCWCVPAEYSLSTTCDHFFCQTCVGVALKDIMDRGKFPAYCPFCQAEAGEGKEPPRGAITGKVLTFLAQRDVITKEFQFRFMLQTHELKRPYFKCPAKCGRLLMEAKEIRWMGPRNAPYTAPGECPCGALVCMSCHKQLQPNEVPQHHCAVGTLAREMDLEMLEMLHDRGIRKCPKCGALIEKNMGCHIMMCGTNAHGNVEVARRMGGCGYEGHWKTFLPLITRNVLNPGNDKRKHSSAAENQPLLGSSSCWRAESDDAQQWSSMDVGSAREIVGVQVQGRSANTPDANQWWRLTKLKVSTSMDGTRFTPVDGGKVFDGPEDAWTKKDVLFSKPITTRHVRIEAVSWWKHVAGRFGVLVPGIKETELAAGKGGGKKAE